MVIYTIENYFEGYRFEFIAEGGACMDGRQRIDDIKRRHSLESVLERLGHGQRPKVIKCLFPERHSHGDRTPSLSLNYQKQMFRCFVCDDVKGDVINFVQLALGVSFKDALDWLEGKPLTYVTTAPQKSPYVMKPAEKTENLDANSRSLLLKKFYNLLSPISGDALKYIVKRKIFLPTCKKYGLRWIEDYARVQRDMLEICKPELWIQCGLFSEKGFLKFYRHTLILPYFDPLLNICYFQARALDSQIIPKELNLSGSIPFPYNYHQLNPKSAVVYLCEGVMDTLTALDKGFDAVGIPGVQNFNKEWVKLFVGRKVYCVFDADEPGEKAAERIGKWFEEEGVFFRRVPLPKGQDVNSYLGGKK
jgi:DNA primase